METTPCGLLKFNPLDSYNFSDAVSNFEREDELLARLGANENRVFTHLGLPAMNALGVQIHSDWNVLGFSMRGYGEWYWISISVSPKAAITRSSGGRKIADLPAYLAAMHTQKLGGLASGRGTRGWINSVGAIWLGTFSGSDASIPAGQIVNLSGWYLPKNDATTIGISTIGEKAPFYSNYVNSLTKVDNACKIVNTKMQRDTKEQVLPIVGDYARLNGLNFFQRDTRFDIESVRMSQINEFVFVAISVKSRGTILVEADGTINNLRLGVILSNALPVMLPSPLESDNEGRVTYSFVDYNGGDVMLKAIGRAGGTGQITIPKGEIINVSGYYRTGVL